MEWSGMQQLSFVPKGAVIGMMVGLLLDISSGYWRGKRYRKHLFVSDVILCAVAAVMTFFGALVFTDGYLHPVLLGGVLMGIAVAHYLLGRWLSFLFYKTHCFLRWGTKKAAHEAAKIMRFCVFRTNKCTLPPTITPKN